MCFPHRVRDGLEEEEEDAQPSAADPVSSYSLPSHLPEQDVIARLTATLRECQLAPSDIQAWVVHLLAFNGATDSDSEQQQAQQHKKSKPQPPPNTNPKRKKAQRAYKPSAELTPGHLKVRIADITRRVGGDMLAHLVLHFKAEPTLLVRILETVTVLDALKTCLGEQHAAALLLQKKLTPEQGVSLILQMQISHTNYTVMQKTFPKLASLTAIKQCMKEHQPDLLPVHVMVKKPKPKSTPASLPQPTPEQAASHPSQNPGLQQQPDLAVGEWEWNPERDPCPAPRFEDFAWERQVVPILHPSQQSQDQSPPPPIPSHVPILPAGWELSSPSTESTEPPALLAPRPPTIIAPLLPPPATAPPPRQRNRSAAALPPLPPPQQQAAADEVRQLIGYVVPRSYIYTVILQGVEVLLEYDPEARELVIKIGGDNFTRIPWGNTGTEHYEQVGMVMLLPEQSDQSYLRMRPLAFTRGKESLQYIMAIWKELEPNLPTSMFSASGREISIRYVLSADCAFSSLMFNHQGSGATCFCLWCKASKAELAVEMRNADGVITGPAQLAATAMQAAAAAAAANGTTITPAALVEAATAAVSKSCCRLRTADEMHTVGQLVESCISRDEFNSVTVDPKKASLALQQAVAEAKLGASLADMALGNPRALAAINRFRCSLTGVPISPKVKIDDCRVEALHATINTVNNAIAMTREYAKQLGLEFALDRKLKELSVARPITGYAGKQCRTVLLIKGEFLPLLKAHPLYDAIERMWVLLEYMLWVLHTAHMADLTADVILTYGDVAAQYEHIFSTYLSQPAPPVVWTSTSQPAPPAPKKPLVTTIKQYEHALMHHVLFQLLKEKKFTIAAAASSWLEAANKMWKHNLTECTSKGGGHKGGAIDQILQVMRRACLGADPAFTQHFVVTKSYKCGKCGTSPKKGHICTAEQCRREAAAAAMTQVVSSIPNLPLVTARIPQLPHLTFARRQQNALIPPTPNTPARTSTAAQQHGTALTSATPQQQAVTSTVTQPLRFHQSPDTNKLAERLFAYVEAIRPLVIEKGQRLPSNAEIVTCALMARKNYDVEKAFDAGGGHLVLVMVSQFA